MIRSVRLNRLPEGIVFPPELAAKISFASDTQELRFEGFMSKTDFDKLLRLNNDLAYQRALEQLFQKCTFRDAAAQPTRPNATRKTVYIAVAASVVVVLTSSMLVWWNRSAGQSPVVNQPLAPPTHAVAIPNPLAKQATATEINHVTRVAHDHTDDGEHFDGEIKP